MDQRRSWYWARIEKGQGSVQQWEKVWELARMEPKEREAEMLLEWCLLGGQTRRSLTGICGELGLCKVGVASCWHRPVSTFACEERRTLSIWHRRFLTIICREQWTLLSWTRTCFVFVFSDGVFHRTLNRRIAFCPTFCAPAAPVTFYERLTCPSCCLVLSKNHCHGVLLQRVTALVRWELLCAFVLWLFVLNTMPKKHPRSLLSPWHHLHSFEQLHHNRSHKEHHTPA